MLEAQRKQDENLQARDQNVRMKQAMIGYEQRNQIEEKWKFDELQKEMWRVETEMQRQKIGDTVNIEQAIKEDKVRR